MATLELETTSHNPKLTRPLHWYYMRWAILLYLPFALIVTALALVGAYHKPADFVFDFRNDQPPNFEILHNFYQPEHNAVSGYCWTKPEFEVKLSFLANDDYKLVLSTFGNPGPNANKKWSLIANGHVVTTFVPTPTAKPQGYKFTIPSKYITNGDLDIVFSGTAYNPAGDPRTLGLPLTRLQLQAQTGHWLMPPLNSYLLALLLSLQCAVFFTPIWKFFGFPARKVLTHAVFLVVLAIPGVVFFWGWRASPSWFVTNLNDLNYDIGRFSLGEYTLIALAVAAQFWLQRRHATAAQPGPVAVPSSQVAVPDAPKHHSTSALTGLRFLAALLVYFNHIPIDNAMPATVYHFFRSGYVGVSLFFVLSGFVLCYNYYDRLSKSINWSNLRSFWVARFARIYPMYLVGMLLAVPLIQPARKVSSLPYQLFLVQSLSADKDILLSFNSPAWSVSVEAFFYLTFPFIIFFGIRHLNTVPKIFAGMFGIFLLQLGLERLTEILTPSLQSYFNYDRLLEYIYYDMPLGRIAEFVIGTLVALLYMRWRNRPVSQRERWVAHGLLILSLAIIIYFMSMDDVTLQVYRYATVYMLPFAFIIFYLVRYPTRLSALLSTPGMLLLGESSYAFYLLHDTILKIFYEAIINLGNGWGEYIWFAALVPVIAALAILSFTFYETPVRMWIRKQLDNPKQTKIKQPGS